jgi:ribosomal protein L11 methyltransferase
MQWLEEHPDLATKTLLDYGCGSGILAIAAKRLGCGDALGVDIDPQAVISAKDNALRNEVTVDFRLPEEDTADSQHDVVVANILANPLQVLAPALCQRIAPHGHIVLSGILERQAQEVIDTYQPWINLHVWRECDGWVCLTGQLNDNNTQKKTLETDSATKPSGRLSKKLKFLGIATGLLLIIFIMSQLFYLGRQAIALQVANLPPATHESGFKIFRAIDHLICQYQPCEDIAVYDFSAWSIELANLKINAPSQPGADVKGILELQIRNKRDSLIAWPHLSLTITDANDSVIDEKVLSPKDWLPPNDPALDSSLGSTGPHEIASNVVMNLPGAAAGFRVRLMYIKNIVLNDKIEDSTVAPAESPLKTPPELPPPTKE